ncbi:MAG: hypothetical protein OEZ13_05020 [Spirochaetia bacterium]|nr:hypothetical protein [Spirochaetia bacterium]
MKFLLRNLFTLFFFFVFFVISQDLLNSLINTENASVYKLSWQKYAIYLVYFFILFMLSRLTVVSFKKKTWQREYEEETDIKIEPEKTSKPDKPIDVIKPKTVEKEDVPNVSKKNKSKKSNSF